MSSKNRKREMLFSLFDLALDILDYACNYKGVTTRDMVCEN
ncbi:hypothetical protein GGR10_000498 [Bartonella chomelii]|uniref:Uncharacterized protein n=1 Tax=Bartonella chomelii TaxID=236402 RepID=A0ABR6E263_9HYPH|nr:hypothetical protein [Bartonella chomelii]